jgi:predicted oxidoreductase
MLRDNRLRRRIQERVRLQPQAASGKLPLQPREDQMRNQQIGKTGPMAPALILGLMRIAQSSDADIRALVGAAQDAGITMIDHADIYGRPPVHHCEARFAEAMQLTPSQRQAITIQTKFGIREGFFDFSAAHLVEAAEGSLKALKTDYIDIILLHRPDALMEPAEVAAAFDHLHSSGKVRHFGVSNHTPAQVDLLKHDVRQPLIANQVQLSLPYAPLVAQGVATNKDGLDLAVHRNFGLIDYSRLHGMTLQAWSPFRNPFTEKPYVGDRENCAELNTALDEIAAAHGVTPTGIATAWITRHPAQIQVVLGTTSPDRMREAVAGAGVTLSREEWYRLFRAAGYKT